MGGAVQLDVHAERLAVCRLDPSHPAPTWATEAGGPMTSVTRTTDELSVVVPEGVVPDDVTAERGWRALSVQGPLDFSLTGVLASLSRPLADAEVPVFVISTYDTDWLLVGEDDLARAVDVLRTAGHQVRFAADT